MNTAPVMYFIKVIEAAVSRLLRDVGVSPADSDSSAQFLGLMLLDKLADYLEDGENHTSAHTLIRQVLADVGYVIDLQDIAQVKQFLGLKTE